MRREEGCQAPLVPLAHGRVSESRGIRKHRPAGGVLLVCHKELYNAAITGSGSVDEGGAATRVCWTLLAPNRGLTIARFPFYARITRAVKLTLIRASQVQQLLY